MCVIREFITDIDGNVAQGSVGVCLGLWRGARKGACEQCIIYIFACCGRNSDELRLNYNSKKNILIIKMALKYQTSGILSNTLVINMHSDNVRFKVNPSMCQPYSLAVGGGKTVDSKIPCE